VQIVPCGSIKAVLNNLALFGRLGVLRSTHKGLSISFGVRVSVSTQSTPTLSPAWPARAGLMLSIAGLGALPDPEVQRQGRTRHNPTRR